MVDRIYKKLTTLLVKPYLTWYLKKERLTRLEGFQLLIKPSVFHPRFFFSSSYFFDFIDRLSLKEKKFMEVGCGSGLLSLLALRKGAHVTCSDINPLAVQCTHHNYKLNFKTEPPNFNCIVSDLFENIVSSKFDFIIINPPYFFESITNHQQLAWNCGKNGEFFTKLFSELNNFTTTQSKVYMILADNCDINRINKIAKTFHFTLHLIEEKKIKWEVNYIFLIAPNISA